MVVAEFVLTVEYNGDKFVPTSLEFGMEVDIDDFHRPAQFCCNGFEGRDQVVAQMAPLPAQYGQLTHHLPARRLTKELASPRSTSRLNC